VQVQGDYRPWIGSGDTYQIVNYHLEAGSVAIDAGIDSSASADGGVLVDIDGVARGFDGDGLGGAKADGSDYDIGAFESDTPVLDSITVESPNGGEVLTRGTQHVITWSTTGNVGTSVKIVARRGTSSAVIANSTPNDGRFDWTVPLTYPLGTNFVVEIGSVASPTVLDTSDALFAIQELPTLTVQSPNGGEVFTLGTSVPISWSSTGNVGNAVNIHARRGTTSIPIALGTSNDGAFDWTLPLTYAPGTDYRIEISSATAPNILDTSDAAFTVQLLAGTITVLSPNGGEIITLGAFQPITWISTGNIGDSVKIVAYRGPSSAIIVPSTPNDGIFEWTVPLNYPLGTDFIVEISSVANPTVSDTSDTIFTVRAAEPVVNSITVLSPNGGESLLRGSVTPITWSSTGTIGSSVKIYVRRGSTGATVSASTPNDGHFDWTVPSYTVGPGYSIEISSVLDPGIIDTSNATFSLTNDPAPAGSITVTAPNGGETYLPGDTIPITWTSSGVVGSNVEIIARGAGQTLSIHAATANDGSYNWLVPAGQPSGTNYTIEVRSTLDTAITDSSNGTFTIAPPPPANTITVVSPNGGETLVRGQTVNITWNSTGTVGSNVKIMARRGSSSGTITSATANDGSFLWTIPPTYTFGSGMIIEISSTTVPSILDTSDTTFTIAP
jgi:hypothetical protein